MIILGASLQYLYNSQHRIMHITQDYELENIARTGADYLIRKYDYELNRTKNNCDSYYTEVNSILPTGYDYYLDLCHMHRAVKEHNKPTASLKRFVLTDNNITAISFSVWRT
jgi:hypothetical protein